MSNVRYKVVCRIIPLSLGLPLLCCRAQGNGALKPKEPAFRQRETPSGRRGHGRWLRARAARSGQPVSCRASSLSSRGAATTMHANRPLKTPAAQAAGGPGGRRDGRGLSMHAWPPSSRGAGHDAANLSAARRLGRPGWTGRRRARPAGLHHSCVFSAR